jgi:hypothetical protein
MAIGRAKKQIVLNRNEEICPKDFRISDLSADFSGRTQDVKGNTKVAFHRDYVAADSATKHPTR